MLFPLMGGFTEQTKEDAIFAAANMLIGMHTSGLDGTYDPKTKVLTFLKKGTAEPEVYYYGFEAE